MNNDEDGLTRFIWITLAGVVSACIIVGLIQGIL